MGQIKIFKLYIVTEYKRDTMAGYLKKSTNMVGMAVAKTPRATLIEVYTKTLGVLGSIPQSSPYRQQVEQITNERLDLVNKTENVMTLEKKINCGQIEEVIIQANDELSLVKKWLNGRHGVHLSHKLLQANGNLEMTQCASS